MHLSLLFCLFVLSMFGLGEAYVVCSKCCPGSACQTAYFASPYNGKLNGCTVSCPAAGSSTGTSPAGYQSSTSNSSGSQKIQCGRVNRKNRIVGGQAADMNEWPWQMAIVQRLPAIYVPSNHPFCGGSLLSGWWGISAAHCFQGTQTASKTQVILGEHNWKTEGETKSLRMNVAMVMNHPKYNSRTQQFDFSLLKFESEVPFSQYRMIRPVCLPSLDPADNSPVWATGWGTTSSGGDQPDFLKEVQLYVLGTDQCAKMNYPSMINYNNICANVEGGGKDACQGDSGGPLVQEVPATTGGGKKMVLLGVTSFGIGCARADKPGVWARVKAVKPWIKQNVGNVEELYAA